MRFIKQTWTLMVKNFRSLLFRQFFLFLFTALILPVLLGTFLSLARKLYAPEATFGIGEPHAIRSLPGASDIAARHGRKKLVLVNNGHSGGDIERVLDHVEQLALLASSDVTIVRAESQDVLPRECRSNLRGVTKCFNALVMHASPNEGPSGFWNYTIRTDGSLKHSLGEIKVNSRSNPEQIYILPMQHAVDTTIAALTEPDAKPLGDTVEYPFTSFTAEQQADRSRRIYHKNIVMFMAVGFIMTVVWVTYHLTGFIAMERESGMSQLIDAMMPVQQQWMAQAARIIAHHLSFSIVYAPGWIISSLILDGGVFAQTNVGIVLGHHILSGLALASMSILYASFFKKAQLSGITAILTTVILAIMAQSIPEPNTATVVVLSFLFAPCGYVYFIILMVRFELAMMPTSLVENPPDSPWAIPGAVFWAIMVFQIFAYPLLGALIESHLYGTSTKGRSLHSNDKQEDAVQLHGFTKVYPPSIFSRLFSFGRKAKPSVIAVDNVTFSAGRGQIVALLGSNGSGKTTTLNAMAGLSKLSGGSITIDGTGWLGIAPQKNVLWENLSVEEHLTIFNRLKAPDHPATETEILDLIKMIDLLPKRQALAKTLSGGQRRKLQLGMMLTGGSAVCCIDEVSSGLDPVSRRKVWDILLAERGKRTLILTTHFLDEADLLADHIVVLSKGGLQAEGSSVELKDRFGGGYKIHVHRDSWMPLPKMEGIEIKHSFDHITYTAPNPSLGATVIRHLEASGISDYQFASPTIEDVFLNLVGENDEETFRGTARSGVQEKRLDQSNSSQEDIFKPELKLLDGHRVGCLRQAKILYIKRFTIFKRNWVPYLIAFALPILAAGLTSLYVQNQEQIGCSAAEQASKHHVQDAYTQTAYDKSRITFLTGPSSRFSKSEMTRLFAPVFGLSASGASPAKAESTFGRIHVVDTFNAFQDFLLENQGNVTTGAWFGDETTPPTISWVANVFLTSSIIAQQFLNVQLTNTTIAATWAGFDIPFNKNLRDALNLVVYMSLALSCYPGFFTLYPSTERRRHVRALQYSNGVRPFPLWAAYLVFDVSIALVSAGVVTALWASVSNVWFHLEYLFAVLFLYAITSTLLAYFVSLFTKTQLAAFAYAAVGQAIGFISYLLAYLCVVAFSDIDGVDSKLLICHFVIAVFAPIGSITRALFLALNVFAVSCDDEELSSNPGGILYYGGPIVYLTAQSVVLFGLLLWFDSGSIWSPICSLLRILTHATLKNDVTDEEGPDEPVRVASGTTNGLRVNHISKSFGKNTAIDNVAFAVKRGEVFALLGPNGAGKSTLISMICGDIKPSRTTGGDIFVEDASVSRSLSAARANLGVCPQVEAIDHMTVREHLVFYAQVRGVPDIEQNVQSILNATGLEALETRMAHQLSGGNKRKLGLGIALIGNPTVLLLDEPSSGLDAVSKRVMWKALASTAAGRSILLTTHSMEEADALATRAGILSQRMLALGSSDELRQRFGDSLQVHLVSVSAPRTTDEEMRLVASWVSKTFSSAQVEEKTYHGQMRFSVRASEVLSLARGVRECEITHASQLAKGAARNTIQSATGCLIIMLEERKEELGVRQYGVGPTTLDQVFLAIVGENNSELYIINRRTSEVV